MAIMQYLRSIQLEKLGCYGMKFKLNRHSDIEMEGIGRLELFERSSLTLYSETLHLEYSEMITSNSDGLRVIPEVRCISCHP